MSDALLNPSRARQYINRVPLGATGGKTAAGILRRSLMTYPAAITAQPLPSLQRAAGGRVEPTDAQKEAGNYPKDHIRFQGLDVTIENRKGSERRGVDKGGRRWSVTIKEDYGYLRGTEGADGDHVDCYLGPDLHASTAYVFDQFALPSRRFDEHKCMLGFSTQQEAERAYERSFSDGKGRERMGKVTPMPMERFKAWVKTDATKARTVRAAGGRVGEDTRSFMVSPQPGLGGLAMASVNLAGLGGLGSLDLSSATRSDDSGDRARLTGDRDRRMADDMKEHHRQRHAMGGPHLQAR